MVDDGSTFGVASADTVKKSGLNVNGNGRVTGGQTDFRALARNIRNSGATAVYYGGAAREAGLLLGQLRTAGFQGAFVGGEALFDAEFINAAGRQAAPAFVTLGVLPADQATGDFARMYREAFHTEATAFAGYAFDATNLLLAGIDNGIDARESMRDHLLLRPHSGVMSPEYRFRATGDLQDRDTRIAVYSVQDGSFVLKAAAPVT